MTASVVREVSSHTAMSRADWREKFLQDIADIAPVLEADRAKSDSLHHLPQSTLDAICGTELLKLKYPSVLGGAEADNALQFEIFERMAYHNAAAAWTFFIYADQAGLVGANLTGSGFDKVFGNELPLIFGGGGMMMGDLTKVSGGYRLTGRWIYGTGMVGSKWCAAFAIDKSEAGPPEPKVCVFPTSEIVNEDNWNMVGMRGTGSSDFRAEDIFVPDDLIYPLNGTPVRGGGLFRVGMVGWVSHTIPAVSVGLAQRALDDVISIARSKVRGYNPKGTLIERSTFQSFVAQADLKLKSARTLMIQNGLDMIEAAERGDNVEPIVAEARAAGTFASDIATWVVNNAVRYAGGEAVREGHDLERALRDAHVAATHYIVNDISLENHARFLMGLEGADVSA